MKRAIRPSYERLHRFFSALSRGHERRVVFMGGSITTGYAANPPLECGWAARVGRWLRTHGAAHGAQVSVSNRGVSGTDSASAVFRMESHVLDQNPDLLILEFGINDQWLDPSLRLQTWEACIRLNLAHPHRAILAVFLRERDQEGVVEGLSPTAREMAWLCDYYQVPWVCPQEGSTTPLARLFPPDDPIHPNQEGHEEIAVKVASFLKARAHEARTAGAMPAGPAASAEAPPGPLPLPLFSDSFVHTRMADSTTVRPLRMVGFQPGSDQHGEWKAHGGAPLGWQAHSDDAVLELPVEGSTIAVLVSESEHYRDMEAWITGPGMPNPAVPIVLPGGVATRRGYLGWGCHVVGRRLGPGPHTLHVRMKDDHFAATGRPAHLCAVYQAGMGNSEGFRELAAPPHGQVVAAADPAWEILGRFAPEAPAISASYRSFSWQGTRLALDFQGPGLALCFASASGRNLLRVRMDDRPFTLEVTEGGARAYGFTGDLSAGWHRLVIEKASEGYFGHCSLAGIVLGQGMEWRRPTTSAPEAGRPWMAIYGDSISAGACVEDGPEDQYDSLWSHDCLKSYAAIAARRMGFDCLNFSVSGTGLTASWNEVILPEVFDRWRPSADAAPCIQDHPEGREPALVLCNLGQNDFGYPQSRGEQLSGDYAGELEAFLRRLRKRYPRSWIVAALGGMEGPILCPELLAGFHRACDSFAAADTAFSRLVFQSHSAFHPRLDTHAAMARELVAHLGATCPRVVSEGL